MAMAAPEQNISIQERHKRVNAKQRRLRLLISLSGAVIIFLTFLAKEARRDKLKELIDSIEAAESSYLMHMGNRQTLQEIKRFENEFAEFRENPTKPVSRKEPAYSSSEEEVDEIETIDYDTLYRLRAEEIESDDLFDGIVRLANKLPDAAEQENVLRAAEKDINQFWTKWEAIRQKIIDVEKMPNKQEHAQAATHLNNEIFEIFKIKNSISEKLDSVSGIILRESEKERRNAEHDYQVWTSATYGLYGIGFIVGVGGILMSGEGESVIESIEEEI
jgi:hypothetical protein